MPSLITTDFPLPLNYTKHISLEPASFKFLSLRDSAGSVDRKEFSNRVEKLF